MANLIPRIKLLVNVLLNFSAFSLSLSLVRSFFPSPPNLSRRKPSRGTFLIPGSPGPGFTRCRRATRANLVFTCVHVDTGHGGMKRVFTELFFSERWCGEFRGTNASNSSDVNARQSVTRVSRSRTSPRFVYFSRKAACSTWRQLANDTCTHATPNVSLSSLLSLSLRSWFDVCTLVTRASFMRTDRPGQPFLSPQKKKKRKKGADSGDNAAWKRPW